MFDGMFKELLSASSMQETQDMANPAFQLAGKIPDKRLQAWSAALLAGNLRVSPHLVLCPCFFLFSFPLTIPFLIYVSFSDLHHSTGDGPQEHAALQALSQTMLDIATGMLAWCARVYGTQSRT